LNSTVKSHGRRTAERAISTVPRAPEANRTRADDASSTVTGSLPPPGSRRSVINVSDWAQTSLIGPAIHAAMSSR
jgi:hypothetical protein